MKIMCNQEHYDKVVQYAESINDTSLQNCLERLKGWEENKNRPCEIELYYDHAPYSFGFVQRYTKQAGKELSADFFTTVHRTNHLP